MRRRPKADARRGQLFDLAAGVHVLAMQTPPTIFADFNNADQEGFVRLNTVGTSEDLARLGLALMEDLSVVISDGDLAARATVRHPGIEGVWRAQIDWKQVIDLR